MTFFQRNTAVTQDAGEAQTASDSTYRAPSSGTVDPISVLRVFADWSRHAVAKLRRHSLATIGLATLFACLNPAWAQSSVSAQASQAAASTPGPHKLLVVARFEPQISQAKPVFSRDGDRFARSLPSGIELWRTQPIQRLMLDTEYASVAKQMQFAPDGRLQYIARGYLDSIDRNLQQGAWQKADRISPNGRHVLRQGLGPPEFTPQYYAASGDIYDTLEKRNLCQMPRLDRSRWAPDDRSSFGGDWFATERFVGGNDSPRPLVVCNLATGEVMMVPFGKATDVDAVIDPLGRWMMVKASGHGFFRGDWSETKLFHLPLDPASFARRTTEYGACWDLLCGQPATLPMATNMPDLPHVSPDGDWLVSHLGKNKFGFFKDPAKEPVVVLAPGADTDAAAKHRLAFSANGNWLALQVGQHLYRVNLRTNAPSLAEVQVEATNFELQDIASDGAHWLIRGPSNEFKNSWHDTLYRLIAQ